mmetsp:Transcript_35759/g.108068  ORF Transcript_35759/g.108068 Transcript_35759/m.108068 type:complete len:235 (-) Transcript_35759:254-958(-)
MEVSEAVSGVVANTCEGSPSAEPPLGESTCCATPGDMARNGRPTLRSTVGNLPRASNHKRAGSAQSSHLPRPLLETSASLDGGDGKKANKSEHFVPEMLSEALSSSVQPENCAANDGEGVVLTDGALGVAVAADASSALNARLPWLRLGERWHGPNPKLSALGVAGPNNDKAALALKLSDNANAEPPPVRWTSPVWPRASPRLRAHSASAPNPRARRARRNAPIGAASGGMSGR